MNRVVPLLAVSLAVSPAVQIPRGEQRDLPGNDSADDPKWLVEDLQTCMITSQP